MSVKFLFRHRDTVDVYRASADQNGNSRFVVHFVAFERLRPADVEGEPVWLHSDRWIANVREALGGKVYRGRNFGGGIVFTSVAVEDDLDAALFGETEADAMRTRDKKRREAARRVRTLMSGNGYEIPRVTVAVRGDAWDINAWHSEDRAFVGIASGSAPSHADLNPNAWIAAFDAELADAGWMRKWDFLPGSDGVAVVPYVPAE